MMEKFTASNGVNVEIGEGSVYTTMKDGSYNEVDHTQALREFFQAERDQELGRWRWPENPDFVVYVSPECTDYDLLVSCESSGVGLEYRRREDEGGYPATGNLFTRAARAYFAAHPAPKPWHDAKPGEVWVLSAGNEREGHAWTVDPDFGTARFVYVGGLSNLPVDHPDITDGRRIWPEVS